MTLSAAGNFIRTAFVAALVVAIVAVFSLQQGAFAKAFDEPLADLVISVPHPHAAAAGAPCDGVRADMAEGIAAASPDGSGCGTTCCEMSCAALLMLMAAPAELSATPKDVLDGFAGDLLLGVSTFDFLRPPRA